jgi:hypothetical protein
MYYNLAENFFQKDMAVQAAANYRKVIEVAPNSSLAEKARERLDEMGVR